MAWIANRDVREKYEELSDWTLKDIAEEIVDLEAEKAELEEQVEKLTEQVADLEGQL